MSERDEKAERRQRKREARRRNRWIRRGSLLTVLLLLLSAMFSRCGLGTLSGWIDGLLSPPIAQTETASTTLPLSDTTAPPSGTVAIAGGEIRVSETTVLWNETEVTVDALRDVLRDMDRSLVVRLRDDRANNSLFDEVEAMLRELDIRYILE